MSFHKKLCYFFAFLNAMSSLAFLHWSGDGLSSIPNGLLSLYYLLAGIRE